MNPDLQDALLQSSIKRETIPPELWAPVLDSLRQECPEAAELAELFSVLGMFRCGGLLTPPGLGQLPEPLRQALADPEQDTKIHEALYEHHCISRLIYPYHHDEAFQAFARARLTPQQRTAWCTVALRMILACRPDPQTLDLDLSNETDQLCDQLASHLVAVMKVPDALEADPHLLAQAALCLSQLITGRKGSEFLPGVLDPTLELFEAGVLRDPLLHAELLAAKAALVQPAQAQALLEQAVRQFAEATSPTDPRLIPKVLALGRALQSTGDLAGSAETFQIALEICEAAHGTDHPRTVSCLLALGDVWSLLADDEAAAHYFERALAVPDAAYGPITVNFPKSVIASKLAVQMVKLKRHRKALHWMKAAQQWAEADMGPDSEELAQCLATTALMHERLKQWKEMVPCLERAVAIEARCRKPFAPPRADWWFLLGRALVAVDQVPRALELLQRAVSAEVDLHGPNSPALAEWHHFLGATLAITDHERLRLAETRKHLEEALRLYRLQLSDPLDPRLADIRERLAKLPPSHA